MSHSIDDFTVLCICAKTTWNDILRLDICNWSTQVTIIITIYWLNANCWRTIVASTQQFRTTTVTRCKSTKQTAITSFNNGKDNMFWVGRTVRIHGSVVVRIYFTTALACFTMQQTKLHTKTESNRCIKFCHVQPKDVINVRKVAIFSFFFHIEFKVFNALRFSVLRLHLFLRSTFVSIWFVLRMSWTKIELLHGTNEILSATWMKSRKKFEQKCERARIPIWEFKSSEHGRLYECVCMRFAVPSWVPILYWTLYRGIRWVVRDAYCCSSSLCRCRRRGRKEKSKTFVV